MSIPELMEKTEERGLAVNFAQLAIEAEDYAKMLRNFADLMVTAGTRINVALCNRPDMQVIRDEAKALNSAEEVGHG
jgi:hypothetical protein